MPHEVLTMPLSELANLTDEDCEALDGANVLQAEAVEAATRAGYVFARAWGRSHDEAVKEANRKRTKVRKALGYAYPKDDLTF